MTFSARNRERMRIWLAVVAASLVLGVGYVQVVEAFAGREFTLGDAIRGAVHGVIIGGGVSASQLFFLDTQAGLWVRRAPFLASLAIRTVIAGAIIIVGLLIGRMVFEDGPSTVLANPLGFLRDIVFSFCAFAVIFFVVQMRRIIGARVLANFVIGRYNKPVREDRVFLFLDLAGSTALARQMGDVGVYALIAQVFFDIDQVVMEYDGETHRYIGDELVVTWPLDAAIEDARCVRCVMAIQDMIAAKAETYDRMFGVVPAFRSGMHGGPVVAGECGDSKQEIVYFGDTINTAARIQAECKALDEPFLVSGDLAARLTLPDGLQATPCAEVRLKGHEHSTPLIRIDHETAARSPAPVRKAV